MLGKVDKGKKYGDIAKKIKKYGKYFTAGKSFITVIEKIILGLIFIFAIINIFTAWTTNNTVSLAKLLTGIGALIIFSILSYFEGIFKAYILVLMNLAKFIIKD